MDFKKWFREMNYRAYEARIQSVVPCLNHFYSENSNIENVDWLQGGKFKLPWKDGLERLSVRDLCHVSTVHHVFLVV